MPKKKEIEKKIEEIMPEAKNSEVFKFLFKSFVPTFLPYSTYFNPIRAFFYKYLKKN